MRLAIPLVALPLLLAACSAFGKAPAGTIPVKFGRDTLNCEIAATEAEREHGLMFRRDLPDDRGMIFVFETPHQASFWMKNTPLPLSIAFLDEDKKVLNVDEMAPYDEEHFHASKGNAAYAIEANANWFEKHGIKAGDVAVFDLPPVTGR